MRVDLHFMPFLRHYAKSLLSFFEFVLFRCFFFFFSKIQFRSLRGFLDEIHLEFDTQFGTRMLLPPLLSRKFDAATDQVQKFTIK